MFTLNAGFQKLWQKIKISGFILAEFREVLPSNRGREDRMRPNCSQRVLKDLMGNIKQHPRRINSRLQCSRTFCLNRVTPRRFNYYRFESFSRATEPLKAFGIAFEWKVFTTSSWIQVAGLLFKNHWNLFIQPGLWLKLLLKVFE